MNGETMKLRRDWERDIAEVYEKKLGFTLPEYINESGIPLKCVYDQEDVSDTPSEMPGQYPYTRGIRALGYQYRPWMAGPETGRCGGLGNDDRQVH